MGVGDRVVYAADGWSQLAGREGTINQKLELSPNVFLVNWDGYGNVSFYETDLALAGPNVIEDWRL